MEASRYYRDVPLELRADDSLPQYSPAPQKSAQVVQSWKNVQGESPGTEKLESQYHPGQKIKHGKWGEGLVLNSVLQDDDEIVDIFFEGVGKKKLIASLADLKIIDP
jgi:DNA helicase-2/ATP-dependent DNA helicase PcrA